MSVTILLVEDEPPLRRLIASALTAAGHVVHEARNGAEATTVFDRLGSAIDLLITDIEMPYVDGPALIAALRRRRHTLKVLGISGRRQPPQSGVDAFLAKPFTRAALQDHVRVLVGGE